MKGKTAAVNPWKTFSIRVDGHDITVNTDSDFDIEDVDKGMRNIASQIAYWGVIWATAEAEKEKTDAWYRAWRAQATHVQLDANPKLAEWKVKAALEEDPKFIELKSAKADTVRNALLAKTMVQSLQVKGNMLQSKGANLRAEMGATGMTTRQDVTLETLQERRKARKG